MSFTVSPGVSFTEIDLTTTVPASYTTAGAFAGVFSWGPIGELYLVDSEITLKRTFLGPSNYNAETWFTAANYLGYGNTLWVSRAANTTVQNVATITAFANVGAVSQANVYFNVLNQTDYQNKTANGNIFAGTGVLYLARYPGAAGNSLRVSVCDTVESFSSNLNLFSLPHSNATANSAGAAAVNTNVTFTVGSNVATITLANAAGFTDLNTTAIGNLLGKVILSTGDVITTGNSVIGFQYLKITGIANTLTVNSASVNTGVAVVSLNLNLPYFLSSNYVSNTIVRAWEFANLFSGPPTQTNYITQFGNTLANDALHVVVVDQGGTFQGLPSVVLETFAFLSRANNDLTVDGSANYYKTVINQNSHYVYWADDRSTAPSSNSSNIASATSIQPLNLQFINGQDGPNEQNAQFGDIARAYDLFADPDIVDISLVMTGKNDGAGVLANYVIQNIAAQRRDCVAFCSPPYISVVNNSGNEPSSIISFRNAIVGSSYAVMDSGYKYQYDKYNDVYRWIPLNGDIAGLCAYTDGIRAPWWSPAGYNRGIIKNVVKLAWNPVQAERDLLYNNAINSVISVQGFGSLLLGDKTMYGDPTSAFSRINVRRLFIVIEQAIASFAKFELFEFNDAFTRAQFVSTVTPYLNNIEGQRGITDFIVICDETNNTPFIEDAEQFIGDIYVKPARAINFIQLNFVAVATGVAFSEVIGSFD